MTLTQGAQVDSDGYQILIDSNFHGAIDSNGRRSIASVDTGYHWVHLAGVGPNCWFTRPAPAYLHLTSRSAIYVNFDVECEVPVPGRIKVMTYTSSFLRDYPPYKDSIYSVVLDDTISHRMTQRGVLSFTGLAAGVHQVQLRRRDPWCRFALSFPPMAPAIRHVELSPDAETVVQFSTGCL